MENIPDMRNVIWQRVMQDYINHLFNQSPSSIHFNQMIH